MPHFFMANEESHYFWIKVYNMITGDRKMVRFSYITWGIIAFTVKPLIQGASNPKIQRFSSRFVVVSAHSIEARC